MYIAKCNFPKHYSCVRNFYLKCFKKIHTGIIHFSQFLSVYLTWDPWAVGANISECMNVLLLLQIMFELFQTSEFSSQ